MLQETQVQQPGRDPRYTSKTS